MTIEEKVKFFDGIADKWDGWEDQKKVAQKLSFGLDELGVGVDEIVVDVGCGTGTLTRVLLNKLSETGRVVAIDISEEMVKRAREKCKDHRVEWHVGDAIRTPLGDGSVDRIICFSVWPHFENPMAAVAEFRRILRTRGALHIWHLCSRVAINGIHVCAGGPVANDMLVPASQTAHLLAEHGFGIYEEIDDDERYLVSARRAPGD